MQTIKACLLIAYFSSHALSIADDTVLSRRETEKLKKIELEEKLTNEEKEKQEVILSLLDAISKYKEIVDVMI